MLMFSRMVSGKGDQSSSHARLEWLWKICVKFLLIRILMKLYSFEIEHIAYKNFFLSLTRESKNDFVLINFAKINCEWD